MVITILEGYDMSRNIMSELYSRNKHHKNLHQKSVDSTNCQWNCQRDSGNVYQCSSIKLEPFILQATNHTGGIHGWMQNILGLD